MVLGVCNSRTFCSERDWMDLGIGEVRSFLLLVTLASFTENDLAIAAAVYVLRGSCVLDFVLLFAIG